MNVVRFNEPFEDGLLSLAKETNTAPMKLVLRKFWQSAPLFEYQTTLDAETDRIKKAMIDVQFKMPFSMLRAAITVGAGERGRYIAHYVAWEHEDRLQLMVSVREMLDMAKEGGFHCPMFFIVTGLNWNDRNERGEGSELYGAAFRYDSQWLKGEDAIVTTELRTILINAAIDSLAGFTLDSMLPTNHIVEVRPDQPGRSVEWTKARTHYTLITHGHPANRATVQHGERVCSDKAGEITRMAHNRRRHQRTYRHARYTYARGQTRWVKATWVGPKEWRDEGGRQIYRILEPAL